MTDPALTSAEIAQRAKSNLALALACLPEERRKDMISFYAFCRVVDDIADSTVMGEEEKERELAHWRRCVSEGFAPGHLVLDEVVPLPRKYGFPRAWLVEIIDGVASDIIHMRYETYDELLGYCYKVASVVGLVSTEIFGATQPQSREYAIQLGYALQLTNIIRDVGQDARETGRIYLPVEDLKRFGVSEKEILEGRHNQRFIQLMDFEYQRARQMYDQAASLLPAQDRDALLPARMMGQVYFEILEKLHKERYPVFEKRCRLHPLRKIWILLSFMARSWLARLRRK
ncbi:squalene/phytoene synthase family protein [Prosthecobacter sp. SYSU 5D2]|uniref:phytoene/squalene synthase family protein n=1 Tax=Prosthecobacter sp. SYSU 5D2 TaxID=3134134 RepID=UPI0031FEE634